MTNSISYETCLKEMFSLRRFGIKLGLETIQDILKSIDNPHKKFKSIHIAGTNGKGSIASFLTAILCKAGYNVGTYTSPHLVKFNERIQINNKPVSNNDVINSWITVKNIPLKIREATFFEYTTAMAFFEFAKQGVDIAIIETGMGGRLDATNILSPIISVISNISLEHQSYLGDTIEQIATEKAGIIKPDTTVITGAKDQITLTVLINRAKKNNSPIYCLDQHFKTKNHENNSFSYSGIYKKTSKYEKSLAGDFQIDNAAVSIAVCEVLNNQGFNISNKSIKEGIKTAKWPGRLEIIKKEPLVILDGAHNLDSAKNLAAFLSQNLNSKKLTLVLGILDDKPYSEMLALLLPFCNKLVITKPVIERSIEPEKLYKQAKKYISDIKIVPKVAEAVKYAIDNTLKTNAVCIAGSLFVVGEAKESIQTEYRP